MSDTPTFKPWIEESVLKKLAMDYHIQAELNASYISLTLTKQGGNKILRFQSAQTSSDHLKYQEQKVENGKPTVEVLIYVAASSLPFTSLVQGALEFLATYDV